MDEDLSVPAMGIRIAMGPQIVLEQFSFRCILNMALLREA